jgi:hypothetical protein
MSATAVVPSSQLHQMQALLSLQGKVGRPSQQICTVIGNLKDLCELQTAEIGLDWRRGTGDGGARGHGGGGHGGGGRPVFRSGGGGGANLPKITSQRSYGSLSSASGHGSPGVAGGGGGSGGGPSTPGSGRYQSMFKNSTQQVEDKILNNIILSKLNKFSGKTYNDIRDFLYQILGSGEPDLVDMIRHFMLLVFKKAAAEETFCPLYAQLLSEISQRYKVILEEMHQLQENYLEIFEDVEEPPEEGDAYKTFLEKNEQKQYRQGYSQFLAECAGLEILELSNLQRTFEHLFRLMLKYGKVEGKKALLEEYADCLVRMSKVLKKKSSPFFVRARQALAATALPSILELVEHKENYCSLSPKARFILMDVKDNLA